jgi:hypothetical protein
MKDVYARHKDDGGAFKLIADLSFVITGLVSVIRLRKAKPRLMNRDGRDKPGDD